MVAQKGIRSKSREALRVVGADGTSESFAAFKERTSESAVMNYIPPGAETSHTGYPPAQKRRRCTRGIRSKSKAQNRPDGFPRRPEHDVSQPSESMGASNVLGELVPRARKALRTCSELSDIPILAAADTGLV
jgi:hypothetical protein